MGKSVKRVAVTASGRKTVARARAPAARAGQVPVYWVTRTDQLEILANTVRLDIMDRLVALGPLSVKELSAAMGRNATAIYHHLKQLEELDLVNATQSPSERGRPAAVYQAAGALVRLARAPSRVENRAAMAKCARAVADKAARDYAQGFSGDDWRFEGPDRNQVFFRCLMSPSPERLVKINALFDEIAALVWTPDPSPGELMSVAWFMSPQVAKKKAAKGSKASGAGRRR